MKSITFNWTWTSYFSNIRIYNKGKLFGYIPQFLDDKTATINNKKFILDGGYISDPTDNKAYGATVISRSCIIIKSPNEEYVSEQKIKSGWFSFGEKTICIYHKSKKVAEIITPQHHLTASGTLTITTDFDNVELLIYLLFYFNRTSLYDDFD
jgi:hypothetical protein